MIVNATSNDSGTPLRERAKMAFEANLSDFTIHTYTVDLNQKVQPLNVNFLDFFCIFLSHLIRRNGKMSGEGLKVEKVAKWATLA